MGTAPGRLRRFLSAVGRYLGQCFAYGPAETAGLQIAAMAQPDPRHPSHADCTWCGRRNTHAKDCPTVTGVYPVRGHEADTIGCARCPGDRLFEAGEAYTFLETSAGYEVCCLSCAAYVQLGLEDGPPPLT